MPFACVSLASYLRLVGLSDLSRRLAMINTIYGIDTAVGWYGSLGSSRNPQILATATCIAFEGGGSH